MGGPVDIYGTTSVPIRRLMDEYREEERETTAQHQRNLLRDIKQLVCSEHRWGNSIERDPIVNEDEIVLTCMRCGIRYSAWGRENRSGVWPSIEEYHLHKSVPEEEEI